MKNDTKRPHQTMPARFAIRQDICPGSPQRRRGKPYGFCARPDVVELAKRADHDDLSRRFSDSYLEQLKGEGYEYTDVRRVKHYYDLLFASRSPKGLEFWQEACTYSPDNQKEMF